MAKQYLDSDLVEVRAAVPDDGKKKGKLLTTLFWGDEVNVLGKLGGMPRIKFRKQEWDENKGRNVMVTYDAVLPAKTRFRDASVLKVRFVDVGQGDGAMIQSPDGKLVLVDGGEGPHIKNYVQKAFSHVKKPLAVDAIVVSHGDADHFAGLTQLVDATVGEEALIAPARIFHNGIVKAPESVAEKARLGKTKMIDGKLHLIELHEDITTVSGAKMNKPFTEWTAAIAAARKRGAKAKLKRLEYGTTKAFDFLEEEDIHVEVLGPITTESGGKAALPGLNKPGSSSFSASHTINGHSIVLRVTYGNVRFMFGADLNEESEDMLLARAREDGQSLSAEILKVPHHGSADFSPAILEAIRPVVSVVSSGDENETKEYIHPRAGLVGALGKYSRASVQKPLVYVTEMVAFFKRIGLVEVKTIHPTTRKRSTKAVEYQNAYVKTSFGIVHVRTDGQRVLVVTHSGSTAKKESYAFTVNERGDVTFEDVRVAKN